MFKRIKNKILKTYTKNRKIIPNPYYKIRSVKPIKAKKHKANTKILLESAVAVVILVLVYLESFLRSLTLFHVPTAIIAILVPGYLLLRGFSAENEKRLPSMLKLALMSCLGIAWTMLIGLAIDVILPVFGNKHPLSSSIVPLLFALATGALIPWALRYKIAPKKNKTVKKINKETVFLYSLLTLTVLLVFCGTRLLNNGYTNILTILAFIVGIIGIAFAVAKQKQLPKNTYPLVLFAISLVCVWSYSLRSNYVFGWDIQQEFQVFQTTLRAGNWILGAKHGAYDAMLSLTILPVTLTKIAGIAGLTFFKVISPVFFSFVPVILYYTYRIFTKKWVSFLASLLVISQFVYMQQFAALVRQQIAFLFFAGILYLIVQNRLTKKSRNTLLLWFIVSLVVSHYATTYLVIAFFSGTYLISKLVQILFRRFKNKNIPDNKKYIQGWLVIVLMVSALVWYVPATHSNAYLQKATEVHEYSLLFKDIKKAVNDTFNSNQYSPKNTQQYLQTIGNQYHAQHKNLKYYPGASNSTIKPVSQHTIKPHVPILSTLMDALTHILNYGWLILGGIGILAVLFSFYKKVEYRRLEVGILGSISVVAVGVNAISPQIQSFYGVGRLLEQVLFLISLPTILVLIWLLRSQSEILTRTIISTLILILFAANIGLTTQLLGGNPVANINNFGSYYSNFYVQSSDISSVQWLSTHYSSSNSVYADTYSSLRLISAKKSLGYSYHDVTPATISVDSFVYADYANKTQNISSVLIGNNELNYQFPNYFLLQNKNLVYSNGFSEVYK